MAHGSPTRIRDVVSGGRPVPRLAKLGAGTLVFGVIFDLSEHSFTPVTAGPAASFSPGEHAAHLVVLIGMVAILLGVIADGVRLSGRHDRPEGSSHRAVR